MAESLFMSMLVLLSISLILAPPSAASSDTGQALTRTLRALEKGLDFFAQEYKLVNLDAVIGTRLVEGQLKVLLRHLNRSGGYQALPHVYSYVRRLQQKADSVSKRCTPVVKATQPNYFYRIGPILKEDFWNLDYPSQDVRQELIQPPQVEGEAMHEEASDDCLTELFGTGEATQETCQVSKKCWYMMTQPGYRGYSLSHQVFYLEIGQQFGCFHGPMLEVLDRLNAGFCANMYQEASDIAANNFPVHRRDLFMEIPALCGMLGYRQFFHADWLEKMLSWQWPRGCWGSPRSTRNYIPDPQDRFKRGYESFGDVNVEKREEKDLPDGCQCHRTAVAIGALTQYIRYIIEYMSQRDLMR